MRNNLIEGTIRGVAKYGMERLTTRIIASEVNLNEAYIYRYFIDRDDLIRKAFLHSDDHFFSTVSRLYAEIMNDISISYRERVLKFLAATWDYMTEDFDYTLFYLRFYSSTFMTQDVIEEHNKICVSYPAMDPKRFRKDLNVDLFMHFMFKGALSFIQENAYGIREDTPEKRKEIMEFLADMILKAVDPSAIENY